MDVRYFANSHGYKNITSPFFAFCIAKYINRGEANSNKTSGDFRTFPSTLNRYTPQNQVIVGAISRTSPWAVCIALYLTRIAKAGLKNNASWLRIMPHGAPKARPTYHKVLIYLVTTGRGGRGGKRGFRNQILRGPSPSLLPARRDRLLLLSLVEMYYTQAKLTRK